MSHVLQDALAAAAEQDAAAAANARQRADQLLAEAEVAAAERMLEAAELEFNSAKRQQTILQQELGQVRAVMCCVLGRAELAGCITRTQRALSAGRLQQAQHCRPNGTESGLNS
jgi:hypothetical protein